MLRSTRMAAIMRATKNLQQPLRFCTGFLAASIRTVWTCAKKEGFWKSAGLSCVKDGKDVQMTYPQEVGKMKHQTTLKRGRPNFSPFGMLVFSAIIAACSSNTNTKSNILDHLDKIEIGMTQEQVVSILGPVEISTTRPGFPPDCDSWAYAEAGQTKYITVQYRYDIPDSSDEPRTVIDVRQGNESYCAIY